jgi:hypothetical protein
MELRAYFFNNMYLGGIQAGIQAQHCTAEMFTNYPHASLNGQGCVLWNWALHHKTTIILNGGYASNLKHLVDLFDTLDNPYPWAVFRESEEALEGCITSVGIIVPENIYAHDADAAGTTLDMRSSFEKALTEEIQQCRLMQ